MEVELVGRNVNGDAVQWKAIVRSAAEDLTQGNYYVI